jgi:hypothetical protein
MPQRSLRLSDDLLERVTKVADSHGFSSVTAFIRASVIDAASEKDFGQTLKGIEESLSATLARLSDQLQGVSRAQQFTIALVEALVKTILTLVPEPAPESLPAAKAAGQERYRQFIKATAASLDADGHRLLNGNLGRFKN